MKTYTYIFIIGVMALLASCSRSPIQAELDRAEALLPTDPDSTYDMLCGMDASALPEGSELEARYALLFTECQYKTYNDAPNDSLISLAADYYEEHGSEEEKFYAYLYQGIVRYNLRDYEKSSVSFMQALANSASVDDSYSLGQLYGNLALVNLVCHCSDALQYAWMAYSEFHKGRLEEYAINAKVLAADSYLHIQNYDSCRILLEQAIAEAEKNNFDFVLQNSISLKAHYAICVDSLLLAEEQMLWLSNCEDYQWSVSDLGVLATISARKGEAENAQYWLSKVRNNCQDYNDTIQYYCSSYWVNKAAQNSILTSAYQDSVLMLAESLLSERLHHTSLASQKDYSDRRYSIEKIRSNQKKIVIAAILSLLILIVILFVLIYRKRQIEIKYLRQTINKLQLEKNLAHEEYERGLQDLMQDDFVIQIRNVQSRVRGLSASELEHLSKLFRQKLPHFEMSLRELIKLSETEWHICMLLKLSFSPGDISILLSKTPGGISSARLRMYQKVFHSKGHTIDWDNFIKGL